MPLTKHPPSRQLILMLCLFLSGKVAANIYSHSSEDEAIHLNNVPSDQRYAVLLPQTQDRPTSSTVIGTEVHLLANKALYDRMVDNIARTYGLESALIHAVISVESKYNPKAVSPNGAAGMMQLMPVTARRYGVTNAFDPAQNIDGGAHHLRDLLRIFDNDLNLALAAYNAGEATVAKYGNRIPPIRETSNYVPKVLKYYRQYSGHQ